ncbi:hypothetical protein KZ810_16535 [Sphingomonas sp. RHCKR47]|nr:hypothetical protein [Sphingomonas citricola]
MPDRLGAQYIADTTVNEAFVKSNPAWSFLTVDENGRHRGFRLDERCPDARMFGIAANGFDDDTDGMCAMAAYMAAQFIREATLPPGRIGLRRSVSFVYGAQLNGGQGKTDPSRGGTIIVGLAGATFTANVAIGLNTVDMQNRVTDGFLNGGGLSNIRFDGSAVPGMIGCMFFGHMTNFERISGTAMRQIVVRPRRPLLGPRRSKSVVDDAYSDACRFVQCSFSAPQDANTYQYDIGGSGDGLIFEQCDFPPGEAAAVILRRTPENGDSSYNVSVRNCINGLWRIEGYSVNFDNWHAEGARLLVGLGATVSVNEANIAQSTTHLGPSIVVDDASSDAGTFVSLSRVTWRWSGPMGPNCSLFPEIQVGRNTTLVLSDCRRQVNGVRAPVAYTGIRVVQADGQTGIPGFAAHAAEASRQGRIDPGYQLSSSYVVPGWDGRTNSKGGVTLHDVGAALWTGATGTYRYRAIRLLDPINLIAAGPGMEVSAFVPADRRSVVALILYSDVRWPGNGPWRIYRGSPAIGSDLYDAYSDVAVIGAAIPTLTDDGARIAGVAWRARKPTKIDPTIDPARDTPLMIADNATASTATVTIDVVADSSDVEVHRASRTMVWFNEALAADCTVTLPSKALQGDEVEIIRTPGATGAFAVICRDTRLAAPAGLSARLRFLWVHDWRLVDQTGGAAVHPDIASPLNKSVIDVEARSSVTAILAILRAHGLVSG